MIIDFFRHFKSNTSTIDYSAVYPDKNIPVFSNGALISITNLNSENLYENRQYAYSSDIILSNNISYDLTDKRSIESIIIPKFDESETVFNLSYIIKMRATAEKNKDIAPALSYKAIELMKYSKIDWTRDDYLIIIQNLWKIGCIQEGDNLENSLLTFPAFDEYYFQKRNFSNAINEAKRLNTDLIVASQLEGTCKVCSTLQARVYSISGKNKQFPQLPKETFKYGGFHKGCRHTFAPFIEDISKLQIVKNGILVEYNAKSYSSRPYIDERTEKDIEKHNIYINELQKKYKKERLLKEYYHLKYNGTENLPSSFNKYLKENDWLYKLSVLFSN